MLADDTIDFSEVIYPDTTYVIACEICGKKIIDYEGYRVDDAANSAGWTLVDGDPYCDKCSLGNV